jgi:hypothetical protein
VTGVAEKCTKIDEILSTEIVIEVEMVNDGRIFQVIARNQTDVI